MLRAVAASIKQSYSNYLDSATTRGMTIFPTARASTAQNRHKDKQACKKNRPRWAALPTKLGVLLMLVRRLSRRYLLGLDLNQQTHIGRHARVLQGVFHAPLVALDGGGEVTAASL